jgi:hypothetical protein
LTDYEIKHYQKGFEVEQAAVGSQVALESFAVPHQTQAERLKEIYETQENFDPETRLYAFKDGKMVGFLTSRVLPDDESGTKKANLTFPSVLAKHTKAEKLLYNKAIEILKKKGVQIVQTGFGVIANKDDKDAIKMGYTLAQENYFCYSIDLSDIDTSITIDNMIEFDFKKHQEKCAKIISEEYGRDLDWANGYYERIKNQPNDSRVHKIIEEEGEIKAYLNFIENPVKPSIAVMQVIYAENEDYMKKLLAYLAKIKSKMKYERIQCAFTEDTDIHLAKYKPIKFEFIGKAGQYTKDI